MTYAKAQAKWVKDNNIHVGSRVLVMSCPDAATNWHYAKPWQYHFRDATTKSAGQDFVETVLGREFAINQIVCGDDSYAYITVRGYSPVLPY